MSLNYILYREPFCSGSRLKITYTLISSSQDDYVRMPLKEFKRFRRFKKLVPGLIQLDFYKIIRDIIKRSGTVRLYYNDVLVGGTPFIYKKKLFSLEKVPDKEKTLLIDWNDSITENVIKNVLKLESKRQALTTTHLTLVVDNCSVKIPSGVYDKIYDLDEKKYKGYVFNFQKLTNEY